MPRRRALLGALCGVAGVALVFWPEVADVALDGPEVRAGLMVALSVLLFSAGGLVGARNQASGMPRFATIGWSMIYGGVVLALMTLLQGERFGFEPTAPYVVSLLYLTVFGSAAVFVLYFEVVERIGAERASYATVLFPLVALGVSTVAEGYRWPALALLGVPLTLLGNALVLTRAPLPATAGRGPGEPQAVERPVDPREVTKRRARP
jgi:drug/metabolite transporter (DMT)-like permease